MIIGQPCLSSRSLSCHVLTEPAQPQIKNWEHLCQITVKVDFWWSKILAFYKEKKVCSIKEIFTSATPLPPSPPKKTKQKTTPKTIVS